MMNWHEWFCYDGINLIWKKSRGRMKAGSIAGCPNDTGRIRVRLLVDGIKRTVLFGKCTTARSRKGTR